MLGSLANYRTAIKSKFYPHRETLPSFGHGMAGILAGWTVSFIAAPVEHVKARLQIQYNAKGSKAGVKYSGPIDCTRKLVFTPSHISKSPKTNFQRKKAQ